MDGAGEENEKINGVLESAQGLNGQL